MPNDPVISSISGMLMQILHEAQGVRDISGAVPGDYETLSPAAGASVQIVNAETGRPFESFVVTLPPQEQAGTGDPALDNVRIMPKYEKIIVQNGDAEPIEISLPDDFYGGVVDLIGRRASCDIRRVRIPPDADWAIAYGSGLTTVFVAQNGMPPYIGRTPDGRYTRGENFSGAFYLRAANVPASRYALYADRTSSNLCWIYPAVEGVDTVEALRQWLTENEIYIYLRVWNPIESDIGNPIPYVNEPNYTVSVSAGTAEITYSGIAPEGTSGGLGAGMASAPETPAIVEPTAEEIKNQEDEEK